MAQKSSFLFNSLVFVLFLKNIDRNHTFGTPDFWVPIEEIGQSAALVKIWECRVGTHGISRQTFIVVILFKTNQTAHCHVLEKSNVFELYISLTGLVQ